jgi:hypothetical protein
MTNSEQVEKTRQAIMRLRELLDLMRAQLEEGEAAYAQLFASLNPDDIRDLNEKEVQRLAALAILDDTSAASGTALSDAALNLRLAARNLERDFEQLYDNLMTEYEDE